MYVVTGASGNSGHIVAEKLLKAGKKVRAIGRSAERLQGLTKLGAEACICDVTDRAALAKAFPARKASMRWFHRMKPARTIADIRIR